MRTAASVLGHAKASVTLGVYSHVIDDAERSALDGLSDRLDRAENDRAKKHVV